MKEKSFTQPFFRTKNFLEVKRAGFTLVEVMLVVVVIAMLAVLSYPSVRGFRLKARLKEVENTVQLIVAAERHFFFKNGSWYSFSEDGAGGGGGNDYAAAEAYLNIVLPKGNDVMCDYLVYDSGGAGEWIVRFDAKDDGEIQGRYNLETEGYFIPSGRKWSEYLDYLE